jgi:acetylornithine deacetylase
MGELTGRAPCPAVSYGTEAGLFQAAGVPSIVCGPGDIARAHKPEEYITTDELDAAYGMILRLGRHLAGKDLSARSTAITSC